MLIRDNIEVLKGNYIIHYDKENDEYYGSKTDDFTLPEKIYGNYSDEVDLWIRNFKNRSKNLGIRLDGLKGMGKTLMAKKFMIESGLPVLVINQAFCGSKFNQFINSINQEVILFFDEFDKVYKSEEHQEELLTLYDGVYDSKKVFLMTSNSNKGNQFFKNRP